MQELTCLSTLGTTPMETQRSASIALPSVGEPLNLTANVKASLCPVGFGEGKFNPGPRPGEPNRHRVPVVDTEGKTLMPCTPVRARARRYRKTRRRSCRFGNKPRKKRLPPSTKARWGAKLKIVKQLRKILSISHAVVEDIKAITIKAAKKHREWNVNFTLIEVGKQYFYSKLKSMGLEVTVKSGRETKVFRDSLGLKKIREKSKPVFESQYVDSWRLAAMVTGAEHPTTKTLYYVVPLRFHRRQLHRFKPSKGGRRKPYGGTMSFSLKKGTLVKHVKHALCYIDGTMRGRFSLHSFKTGEGNTQSSKREDFIILTRITFRNQFLSTLRHGGLLGWLR